MRRTQLTPCVRVTTSYKNHFSVHQCMDVCVYTYLCMQMQSNCYIEESFYLTQLHRCMCVYTYLCV